MNWPVKSRRILHGLGFAAAALTTLVTLFYAEEDWRGARAWAATQREMQARGVSLDLRDFIPPPVPDAQNLAMASLFVRAFRYQFDPKTRQLTFDQHQGWTTTATFKALNEMPWGHQRSDPPVPAGYGNWLTGHPMELPALQAYYAQRKDFPHPPQPRLPAEDILLALTRFSPLLDELAQAAAERPQARFPVNYTHRPASGINMPHYHVLDLLATTLRLRACAELAAGKVPAARQDLELGFRLQAATERDPTVIAPLVQSTIIGVLMQGIWEGLAARQWSAEDLDAFRERFGSINILRDYQRAIGGERALFFSQLADDLRDPAYARQIARNTPLMSNAVFPSSLLSLERWLWDLFPFLPRGWYELNMVAASHYFADDILEAVDAGHHRVDFRKARGMAAALQRTPLTPGNFFAKYTLGVYVSLTAKFAQAQTIIDQAATACALEHYYLDHHGYPAALTSLVPTYLERVPNDVIDGAPMRYRLTVDGRYKLWSVGWNGSDDGGTIAWPPLRTWSQASGTGIVERPQRLPVPPKDQGDWVWQYAPAFPPEPPNNETRLEPLSP